MQVTKTLSEGLKRHFNVTFPSKDLSSRFESELENVRSNVALKGFRPGKVPKAHVMRLYGGSIREDILQKVIEEAHKKIIADEGIRYASEPKMELVNGAVGVDDFFSGKVDMIFNIEVEVLPQFELQDHSSIEIVREDAEIPSEEIDVAIERMSESNRPFTPAADGANAKNKDRVTIDFIGKIDDIPFEGGKGENVELILGTRHFIPGFEDQIIGASVGEIIDVKICFPEKYHAANLAGKDAVFYVTVKAIATPGDAVVGDDLAKKFGIDSEDKLREAVAESMKGELQSHSRQKMKRQLLDALDKLYDFDLPSSMIEGELQSILRQLNDDMLRSGGNPADNDEESARAEYLEIAKRRVRLGLVLAEIGQRALIRLEEREVMQGVVQRAQQYPGQEKQIFDYYRSNPEALAEIRAPLFEEKVIDHILSGVKITEKTVTREELLTPEAEDIENDLSGEESSSVDASSKKKAIKSKSKEENAEFSDAVADNDKKPKKSTKKKTED